MTLDLESAIKHCEEVAEENDDFKTATANCQYWHEGFDDYKGGWIDTCRHPDNIPEGCSWGECDFEVCPIFEKCLECASEYRQLAEWLRELKKDREILDGLRIYFQSLVVDAVFNQRPMMFDMRDATKEERESVKRYIADSASTTGVNFWSLIGEVNADDT